MHLSCFESMQGSSEHLHGGQCFDSIRTRVSTHKRPPPLENSSVAVLPASSDWYRWNTTILERGGTTINETIGLSEMVVFVRTGALLALQANATIQHTGEAGGLLELQVYGGTDGRFVMVEDDGISLD